MSDKPPRRQLLPLLFSNSVWVLLRPTELIVKSCETGPTVYRPYPRRLESLTICRYYYKGSTWTTKGLDYEIDAWDQMNKSEVTMHKGCVVGSYLN